MRPPLEPPLETIDSFHTRLQQLALNCEFVDTSKEVKSQIIQGCHSTRLRRKALRDDTDLTRLLSAARALELSEKHAIEIEQSDRKSNPRRRNNSRYLQKQSKHEPKKKTN